MGYFEGTCAINDILTNGGDVLGTVKQSPELPYTVGKQLGPNDKRIILDPIGSPCLFISEN